MRGQKNVRYVILELEGESNGEGKLVSRHRKLSRTKKVLGQRRKDARLNGSFCTDYIWDLKRERRIR